MPDTLQKQKNLLRGSIVPLLTPFLDNGDIDARGIRKLIAFQKKSGTDALFMLGGCGEGTQLTHAQQADALLAASAEPAGLPLLIGISDTSLDRAKENIRRLGAWNPDAYVATLPFYSAARPQEQLAFYAGLADYADRPVVMYNMPATVKVDIHLDVVRELSTHTNIMGLKESTDNVQRHWQLALLKKEWSSSHRPYPSERVAGGDHGAFGAGLHRHNLTGQIYDKDISRHFRPYACTASTAALSFAQNMTSTLGNGMRCIP